MDSAMDIQTRVIGPGLAMDNAGGYYAGSPLPVGKDVSAALTPDARAFFRGDSVDAGGLNEPLSPYQQSLWVYRCVSAVARAVAGIPWRLARGGEGLAYAGKSFSPAIRPTALRSLKPLRGRKAVCIGRADDGELVESGPAAALLAAPNERQSLRELVEELVSLLLLRGAAALVMPELQGRAPTAIYVVDGRQIEPQWQRDGAGIPRLLGYVYKQPRTGARVAFAPDEVKWFRLWCDSDNPFVGMSPAIPARLAVATDFNASLFNASLLVNGSEPGVVYTFPPGTMLDQQQRDAFRAEIRQRHQGPARAKRDVILGGGADAKLIGANMADLQFDQGKRTTRLELCAAFGVPPVVAGWVDAAGDSSAYTANALRQFYSETVFPMLDLLAPAIAEVVSRLDSSLVCWADVEDQPVVQDMRLSRLTAATTLFGLSYPPNAINDVLDLGMPRLAWGDVGYLAAGLLPAADVAAGDAGLRVPEGTSTPGADLLDQPSDDGQPATDRNRMATEAQRTQSPGGVDKAALDRLWQSWWRSWSPLANRFRAMVRSHLLAQQRAIVASLRRAMADGAKAAVVKSDVVASVLLEVFGNAATGALRARVRALLTDANELGIRQALREAGLSDEAAAAALKKLLANPAITQAMQSEAIRISGYIDGRTRQALRRSLTEGLDAGEDIRALTDRVEGLMQTRRAAAMGVARNAVGGALSKARHDGAAAAGMNAKLWVHSRGPGERRPAHIAAEATYSTPIPLDQPFVINGVALMYPRDWAANAPAETVNCQCLQIARRLRDAAALAQPAAAKAAGMAMLLSARRCGFVSYGEMLALRAAAAAPPDATTGDLQ